MIQENRNDLIAEKKFEEQHVRKTSDKKGARIEYAHNREGRLVHGYCKAGGAFDD
jgi:hypothetical protein